MIGKLPGHTQVQTSARYAHLDDATRRDAAELVSPNHRRETARGWIRVWEWRRCRPLMPFSNPASRCHAQVPASRPCTARFSPARPLRMSPAAAPPGCRAATPWAGCCSRAPRRSPHQVKVLCFHDWIRISGPPIPDLHPCSANITDATNMRPSTTPASSCRRNATAIAGAITTTPIQPTEGSIPTSSPAATTQISRSHAPSRAIGAPRPQAASIAHPVAASTNSATCRATSRDHSRRRARTTSASIRSALRPPWGFGGTHAESATERQPQINLSPLSSPRRSPPQFPYSLH